MKIFFDTNVILDIIQGREGSCVAQRILEYSRLDNFSRVYISFLSVANCAYVLRKLPHEEMLSIIKRISAIFYILPCNDMQILNAGKIATPDYEDALQIACAEAADCDVILSSNTKHFCGFTAIPVLTPSEFVGLGR